MKKIHFLSDNIISPLGSSTEENFNAILSGKSGVVEHVKPSFQNSPFYASLIDDSQIDSMWQTLNTCQEYTRFEKIAILSIFFASKKINIDLSSPDTLFILSTTKGNIALIDPTVNHQFTFDRVHLWKSAKLISEFFGNKNIPIVISSACISGVSALIMAKRLLTDEKYKNIVVCGADEVSRFIFAGFGSLKALSPLPCRPYDKDHCGLNLGEGAATIILSNDDAFVTDNSVFIMNGAISDDANHISGPSRTGEGLFQAISRTIVNFPYESIAFVNAHGTATVYNDDMESIAINRAGLSKHPLLSFKGYYGHTMGAAGVIETVLSANALQKQMLPASYGYKESGTPVPVNVPVANLKLSENSCVKTASGFGGCNASLLLSTKNKND